MSPEKLLFVKSSVDIVSISLYECMSSHTNLTGLLQYFISNLHYISGAIHRNRFLTLLSV